MLQYAIYRDPLWSCPRSAFAVVPWLLDVDGATRKGTGMAMDSEGYESLELARAAVLTHGRRTRVEPTTADDANLVEVWI